MNVTCPECGQSAPLSPAGRGRYKTTMPPDFALSCPVIAGREQGEQIEDVEPTCPVMDHAIRIELNSLLD